MSRVYDAYQFVIVGLEMIGKTSIINRYFDNIFFKDLARTIAVDYKSKSIQLDKNTTAIIRMWDTAGQERFDALSQSYYKSGDCILLTFSICNKKSFERLEYYWDKICDYKNKDAIIILVGTWGDKADERVITKDDIDDFIYEKCIEYFEVSSLTGVGINEMFNRCISLIYEDKKNKHTMRKVVYDKFIEKQNKQTQCCIIQ